jgi:flagellar FliL protein
MADTDTFGNRSHAEDEASIRAMRAGESPDGAPPEKKSKKKIVVLLLVVLLAGGGGAAYKFLMAKENPELAEVVEEPETEILEPVQLVYIDLDPLFVPFQTSEGRRHKIVVVLSLEVEREEQSDKIVRSLLPCLRESYVRSLTSRPFPGTGDGTIKIVYLKNRIRAENNRILGTGVVNDVLVRDVRVLPG